MTRYLAIILACFATEHEESKQAAKQEAKKTSVRPDFSAAYKRASAKWKSSKLCVQAEGQDSSSSLVRCTTSGRLSAVAMEAAAASGVGLNAKLARRTSSPLSGHGSAARQEARLEAGAAPKDGSTAKKPRKPMERKSTERQSASGRARPPPAPKPEEMMSEDQAALALQNKWRQHEARVLAKSMREYRSEVQLRKSRVASYNDPLHLDVSVPVYMYVCMRCHVVCAYAAPRRLRVRAGARHTRTHTHTHIHTHTHTHDMHMHMRMHMHMDMHMHMHIYVRAPGEQPIAPVDSSAPLHRRPWRRGGTAAEPGAESAQLRVGRAGARAGAAEAVRF